MSKVQKIEKTVYMIDGVEFVSMEEATEYEMKLLIAKLEKHCYEYAPNEEDGDWVMAQESLLAILILLKNTGQTNITKLQELIEEVSKPKSGN